MKSNNANVSINVQIYDLLLQSGPLSPEIISQVLKEDKETVNRILDSLAQKGLVAKIDEERYVALPRIYDLMSRISEIKRKIIDVKQDIESKFKLLESKVDVSLDNIVNVVKERLNTSLNLLEKTLTDLLNSYKQLIMNNVTTLQEYLDILLRLSNSLKHSVDFIQTKAEDIKKGLATVRSELKDGAKADIKEFLGKADSTIRNIGEGSLRIISEKISAFEANMSNVTNMIIKSLSDIESSIKGILGAVDKILTEIAESETNLFKNIEDKLKTEFESAPDALFKSIMELVDNKMSELDELLGASREVVIARVNALITGSIEFMRELRAGLTEIVQSLEQAFGEASDIFVSSLGKRIDDAYGSYLSKIDEIKNNLIMGSQRLKELALSNIETVKTVVSGALLSLRENTRRSTSEEILSRVRQIGDNINKLSEVSRVIEIGIKETNMKYSQIFDDLIKKIQEDINSFSTLFDKKMLDLSNFVSRLATSVIEEAELHSLTKSMSENAINAIKQYLDRVSSSIVDANKELLLELKLNIEKQLDNLRKLVNNLELEQNIKVQLQDEISVARSRLIGAIDARIGSISQILDMRTKAFEQALKDITENIIESQISTVISKAQSKINESVNNLSNEISWLRSEIHGRLKVLVEKRRAFEKDLLNELSSERLKFFEAISNDLALKVNETRELIKELKAGVIAFRDKHISIIKETAEKLKSDIDSSFSSLITTISNNINRINSVFGVLVDNSKYIKNEIQKAVASEFGTLTEKIRSEIDLELSRILSAVDGYAKKIDAMIRDSLAAIDQVFDNLKSEMNASMSALKDNLSQSTKTFIDQVYPIIMSVIKEKQDEILKLLSKHREIIQRTLQEKIIVVNKLSGDIESDLNQLKEGTIQIFKEAEKPIADLSSSAVNRISEDLAQLENRIGNTLSEKIEKVSKNYDAFTDQVNMSIRSLESLVEGEVIPKYRENIESLNNSFQGFGQSLEASTESIKAPIVKVLEDLEKTLEEEKNSVKSVINDSVRDVSNVFNDFLQISEKLPSEIDNVMKKYIEALKARPKGLFIVYGVDVVATIVKDMARRAKEVLVVIVPVLDDSVKEILEVASKSVLVEVFTSKILAEPSGHVFIFTMPSAPQNLFVASIDNSELIMIVDSKEGKKVGIIFEGEPVKTLLSTLVR